MSDPTADPAAAAFIGFFFILAGMASLVLAFVPAIIGRSKTLGLINILILPLAFMPFVGVVFWLACMFAALMTRNQDKRRREQNQQHREMMHLMQEQRAATP